MATFDRRIVTPSTPRFLQACQARDAGTFVRAVLAGEDGQVDIDLVFDAVPDVGTPGPPVEGVQLESFEDLRANKLTCVLSRSEPRDLVDLLFLDRAGCPPERDLGLALAKDGCIDAGPRLAPEPVPRTSAPPDARALDGRGAHHVPGCVGKAPATRGGSRRVGRSGLATMR